MDANFAAGLATSLASGAKDVASTYQSQKEKDDAKKLSSKKLKHGGVVRKSMKGKR